MKSLSAEELAEKNRKINEGNKKIARNSSWLYKMFEDHNLTLKDKQEVLRRTFNDFNLAELEKNKVMR